MSAAAFLESTVSEMHKLLVGIAEYSISFQTADREYEMLRKRLGHMASIAGPMPPFLHAADTPGKFWDFISKMETYADRRSFLKTNFTDHYQSRIAAPASEADINTTFMGRDLLLENKVGEGGFGEVYRATHMALGSPRAVKIFNPSFYAGEAKPLLRFAREAMLLDKLSHPNIVRFYDAGVAGRAPFIVTEFVEGSDLQAHCDKWGHLDERETAQVCIQVLDGLETAHRVGVFHRDIKPRNLMLLPSRRSISVKILDFGAGIAMTDGMSRITTSLIGTSAYIAPELHNDPLAVGSGPDLYSLGVTAHYLLTGMTPNAAAPDHILKKEGVSAAMIDIIARSLQIPEQRFQDASEMRSAFQSLLEEARASAGADGVQQ